jgi:hypothetical protein
VQQGVGLVEVCGALPGAILALEFESVEQGAIPDLG